MRPTPSGGIMDVVAQPLSKNATWQKDKKEEATVSSEAEQNKTLVRRLFEARGKPNMDAVEKMLAPHFLSHTKVFPGQQLDREGFKRMTLEYHAAFSNTRFIVEEWSQGSGLAELTQQRLEQERVERERIEQELEVARSIQQASLPKEVPTPEGWQISPFYQPAREVGGDFYDFFELPEGRLGLVVGDATGKGVPAALVMASARSMLRAVAQGTEYSPGGVLGKVNDALATDIPPNMFITCFYAILDPESGRLLYANAGHDLPYVWQSGEAEELRARGMPLGLMPGMSYEQKEIVLEWGDSALFYSDGLVEAHDPQRDMFGFLRLRALVREHGKQESLEEALLEQLYSFVGEGWEQEDDITLLTLKRSASLS